MRSDDEVCVLGAGERDGDGWRQTALGTASVDESSAAPAASSIAKSLLTALARTVKRADHSDAVFTESARVFEITDRGA